MSFRLAGAGIDIRYVPTAIVEHHHPESLWAYLRRKFSYGRAAPALYKRFPGKSLRDSSTPPHRRVQLALMVLGMAALPFSGVLGALLILAALALTFPAAARTSTTAPVLAVVYPLFSLVGSLAFLLGWSVGTLALVSHLYSARSKGSFRA